ncbi:MAG TPA: hypothetical protein VN253_23180 [Kofleriaceae bacterium]|nr:hypothetical protein [Kofleriaceae bacterium]
MQGSRRERTRQSVAALAVLGIGLTGCFGYNKSAKRWSYAGDSVLILGGGGAIAADVLTKTEPPPCTGRACPYESPISGAMLAGSMLVTAGLIGIVINATRPNVKTSR